MTLVFECRVLQLFKLRDALRDALLRARNEMAKLANLRVDNGIGQHVPELYHWVYTLVRGIRHALRVTRAR